MFLSNAPTLLFTFLGCVLTLILAWLRVRNWYFQLVFDARHQVSNFNGEMVPGKIPKMLLGNIPDVYGAKNRLTSYNAFHQQFGEIVQIFWLWRHQISISNYKMARQVLMENQKNYEKYPPNSLLQNLFGHSILTSKGEDWKRQRLIMMQVFSKQNINHFHDVFVGYSERLVHKWNLNLNQSRKGIQFDTYPDLIALFLDIIGKTTIGKDFGALDGESDEFLEALQYIEYQSTRPLHQFVKWWKYVPLFSNRRLKKAFATIDHFLYLLINEKYDESALNTSESNKLNILDSLLNPHPSLGPSLELDPLNQKEVRDNILALIVNGHETVATTVALSLYLLARNPDKMERAQAEIDSVMGPSNEHLTEDGISQLNYLNCVLLEALRISPAVAGLQRIGKEGDLLETWSTPSQQVIGISLEPLHRDPKYFGTQSAQFHPERYLNPEFFLTHNQENSPKVASSQTKCPFSKLWKPFKDGRHHQSLKSTNCIHPPLTFGAGARKCLGEHFAMYEMKVVLATLLYHFNFQEVPSFEVELELGKFGLFLSTFLKDGVELLVTPRTH